MTDVEINKLIHEKLMGECWHETFAPHKEHPHVLRSCVYCGHSVGSRQAVAGVDVPDYYNSLDAVYKAENKIVENGKIAEYSLQLFTQVFGYEYPDEKFVGRITPVGALKFARATAKQRATAIYNVLVDKDTVIEELKESVRKLSETIKEVYGEGITVGLDLAKGKINGAKFICRVCGLKVDYSNSSDCLRCGATKAWSKM